MHNKIIANSNRNISLLTSGKLKALKVKEANV